MTPPRTLTPTLPFLDRQLFSLVDQLLKTVVKHGFLKLCLPDGSSYQYGHTEGSSADSAVDGAPTLAATVTVLNSDMFYKFITRHDTGLAEAFMSRDFEVDDLGALMAVITANAIEIEQHRGKLGVLNFIGGKMLQLAHLARPNTIEGSRRNISEHYDAGNDMYKLFLDDTMTYSGGIHMPGDSLEQAQFNKLDALIAAAGITADSNVLEIGCGWGSCAIRAAQQTGCKWTGITVSKEQLVEAQARVKAAGLSDRVTLLFCDYRDVPGTAVFDAVVSCEMIEAVGHEHLPTYFAMVGRVLKPGGLFSMQVITMPDERYEAYCNSSDFIREYIFPGGHLPSMAAMLACAGCASLAAVDVRDVGPHYAVTLREWRRRWTLNWDKIRALGYPDAFMRKYEFYFAYCEAPFDSGYIKNYQVTWRRAPAEAPASADVSSLVAAPAAAARMAPIAALAPDITSRPLTFALVGVYFLLVGLAIAQQPHMWLAPIVCALCIALFQVFNSASRLLAPGFMFLSPMSQAWWTLNCVHLLFSIILGASSLSMLLKAPIQAIIWPQQPLPSASLLVSAATGFFGFQLYGLLRHNIHHRCPKAVVHFTVLLLLFGVSAFKREHIGLLALTLPAELAVVPDLVLKMYKLLQRPVPLPLRAAKIAMDGTLRLALHSAIAVVVVVNPFMWSTISYYALACSGIGYITWLNVSNFIRTVKSFAKAEERAGQSVASDAGVVKNE